MSLDWSLTNIEEQSCKAITLDCLTYWEYWQQEAIKRMSNLQDENKNIYKLEPGYEARARRIAATYASIFLEKEVYGNENLKGRYYWMGLGAFASKTVAAVFKDMGSRVGYEVGITEALDRFAWGNLWLYMDISVWHFGWSACNDSFDRCKLGRDLSQFQYIYDSVMNLPWSKGLANIKYLQLTDEIEDAFNLLPIIEAVFEKNVGNENKQYGDAARFLYNHLIFIANQEQRNILQKLFWNKWQVHLGAILEKVDVFSWISPEATLILSRDYSISSEQYRKIKEEIGNDFKSDPNWYTYAPSEDSRMAWIVKAADMYHDLMQTEKGRGFIYKELESISEWANDIAESAVDPSSNEGKK